MNPFAFSAILVCVFLFGLYAGWVFFSPESRTHYDPKDLEKARQQYSQIWSKCVILKGSVARYRMEVHKLNRAMARRMRQIQNLKRKMEQAGVPAHTPGTRRDLALSATARSLPGRCADGAGSTGTGSHKTPLPTVPAADSLSVPPV